MNFSNYLQFPIHNGAILSKADLAYEKNYTNKPEYELYSKFLVDNINNDNLTNMEKYVPSGAYRMAYISGSVVKNRLGKAQIFWDRLVELFELEKIIEDLCAQYGRRPVDKVVSKIKKMMLSRLLCDRTKVGPAILLFRMKKPTEQMLSPENYSAIEQFIENVANSSRDCADSVRDILCDVHLGDARSSVTKQLKVYLKRFELHGLRDRIFANFKSFIQIQKEAQCLHPAMPMTEEAVWRIAQAFGIETALARRLIVLFRFAWLCRFETSKDFSDLVPKSLCVIPQPDTSFAEVQRQAETLRVGAIDALEQTLRTQVDLQQFRAHYPDVQVDMITFVVFLPRPLFEVFLALDSGDDRLTFLTKYQMGQSYFQRYIEDIFHNSHYKEKIHAIDVRYFDQLRNNLNDLISRTIYLKIKIKNGQNMNYKTISPRDFSSQQVYRSLEKTIKQPKKHLEKSVWIFHKIIKEDLAGILRGVWTVQ